jgi:hypothetical protein
VAVPAGLAGEVRLLTPAIRVLTGQQERTGAAIRVLAGQQERTVRDFVKVKESVEVCNERIHTVFIFRPSLLEKREARLPIDTPAHWTGSHSKGPKS